MSWCLSGRALVKQPRMGRRCSWVHRDPPLRQDPKTKDRTGQMTANGPAWHKQSGEWLLPRDWLKLGKSHWLDTCEWVHSSEHNIISCASKSRAKNVKEVLIPQKLITSSRRKTWQPKEVTSPRKRLWWLHTKLMTKAGKSHQSATEILRRSFTRHIQHSVQPVMTQSTFQGINHLLW